MKLDTSVRSDRGALFARGRAATDRHPAHCGPNAGLHCRAAPHRHDPRLRVAERAERALRYLAPEFLAIHPVEAQAPEEDVLIMDSSFLSPTIDASLRVPSNSAWFRASDQRPMYRYFRRAIQLPLWQKDGRWLAGNRQHRHGMHRYQLRDFGLVQAELDTRFESYRERFGVRPER